MVIDVRGLRPPEEQLALLLVADVRQGRMTFFVAALAVVAAAPKSQQQANGRILLQTLLVHDVGDGFGREMFDGLIQHARLARAVMLAQPERHLKIIWTVQHR